MSEIVIAELKTKGRWDVLKIIARRGEVTYKDIMRELKLSRATVVNCVDDLESLGLVESAYRVMGLNNVSQRIIKLTEKGQRVAELLDKVEKYLNQINDIITEDTQKVVA
jgi:DNA-binding MarR family transcriptional regulator